MDSMRNNQFEEEYDDSPVEVDVATPQTFCTALMDSLKPEPRIIGHTHGSQAIAGRRRRVHSISEVALQARALGRTGHVSLPLIKLLPQSIYPEQARALGRTGHHGALPRCVTACQTAD